MSRGAWEFTVARSAFLHSIFDRVSNSLASRGYALSIAQGDGAVLHVRPQAPEDVATLSFAAANCHRYLKLRDGDLAIINDPASGGTSLSSVTIVTSVVIEPGFDLHLAIRYRSTPVWGEKCKLDDEGVRIPPMPLGNRQSLNHDLVNAMASHPLAAADFTVQVEQAAAAVLATARDLQTIARDPKTQFSSGSLKVYLEDSRKMFDAVLAEKLPLGSANIVTRVPGSRETLKLHLEVNENRVSFDFKGSDTSEKVALTELITLGSSIWAVLALIGENVPINSAVIDHFQVSAPSGSLLSWRNPQGLERGLHVLVPAVCETVALAFAKLNPALGFASSPGTVALAELTLGEPPVRTTIAIAPGAGATATKDGSDAFPIWGALHSNNALFAQEADGALELSALGAHIGSGGRGTKSGGDGALISVRAKHAGTLRWLLGASSVKHEGRSGGRSGAAASIEIVRDGKIENLEGAEGLSEIQAGDEIRMMGAGGGGFGAPSEPTT